MQAAKRRKETEGEGLGAVLACLPGQCRAEIERLALCRVDLYDSLSEIRLRAPGRSSIVVGGGNLTLFSTVTRQELGGTMARICRDSLYAFRDAIGNGYLPMTGGVRVGVCGEARYEGGRLVGVSEVSALVFRIPHGACDCADELFAEWERGIGAGMLIYAPPGGGKTTALRALAARIGGGGHPMRVVVVDERSEFCAADYTECTVDILRGYHRALGLEIAVRTLSPQVILMDEIGGEGEARAMLGVIKGGVPVIATAHARSYAELVSRKTLVGFLESGVFDVFVGLRREGGRFVSEVTRRK